MGNYRLCGAGQFGGGDVVLAGSQLDETSSHSVGHLFYASVDCSGDPIGTVAAGADGTPPMAGSFTIN